MSMRLAVLIIVLSAVGPRAARAQEPAAQVSVIANLSVPADTIERGRLLDIYTGDVRRWDDGLPVIPVDLEPKTPAKEAFYAYLGKSTSRMKSIWLKRKLAGEGDPPEALPDEAALVARVRVTPGAIGFVGVDCACEDVKVLALVPAPPARR